MRDAISMCRNLCTKTITKNQLATFAFPLWICLSTMVRRLGCYGVNTSGGTYKKTNLPLPACLSHIFISFHSSSAENSQREGWFTVDVASPGFGSAANSYSPLINVNAGTGPKLIAGDLHRSRDPGAGASTAYVDRKSTASQHIAAGEELFVDYGASWFVQRPHFGAVPLHHDFNRATVLTNKYFALAKATKLQVIGDKNQSQLEGSEEVVTSNRTLMDDLWNDFLVNTTFKASRVLFGIKAGDRELLMELGIMNTTSGKLDNSSTNSSNSTSQHGDSQEMATITAVRKRETTQTVEWLRTHGTCGDHLAPGPSVAPQAGLGAFATRTLPAGIVVAQMPLVHITDRNKLAMYPMINHTDYGEDGKLLRWYFTPDRNQTKNNDQLMINYCFGHRTSTLLLCPYGPMTSYINHAPTHSDDPATLTANVKIQWGHPDRGNHMPSLLNQSIEELESSKKSKLAFEVVSLREIRAGEEVLLDYGEEWSLAWEHHVSQWKPREDTLNYTSAYEFNHPTDEQRNVSLRTVFQQIDDPYPDNVEFFFNGFYFAEAQWREARRTGAIKDWGTGTLFAVEILRSKLDEEFNETVYHVAIMDYAGQTQLVGPVPRQAIFFRNKPYTTDMLQPFVFRHDMRIPDDMFPLPWRNLLFGDKSANATDVNISANATDVNADGNLTVNENSTESDSDCGDDDTCAKSATV
jgi:hypothetical protein